MSARRGAPPPRQGAQKRARQPQPHASERAPQPRTHASKPQPAALLAPIRHAAAITPPASIQLDGAALAGVRAREVRVSEAFTLIDAQGAHLRASLKSEQGECLVYERMAQPSESPLKLTLACAILSRQRMLWIAQKAAELGCARLVPLWTAHSVPPGPLLEKEKPWAWTGQALKGSRQCRRAQVMAISAPITLRDYVQSAEFRQAERRYALDDVAGAAGGLHSERNVRSAVLLIGPEGGFHDDERALLARCDVRALRLGSRVLRAETAVLVGAALLQHHLGDLR